MQVSPTAARNEWIQTQVGLANQRLLLKYGEQADKIKSARDMLPLIIRDLRSEDSIIR
jgi:hypothetical protein